MSTAAALKHVFCQGKVIIRNFCLSNTIVKENVIVYIIGDNKLAFLFILFNALKYNLAAYFTG